MSTKPSTPSIAPAAMVTTEAAVYIGRDPKTLANWRSLGIGPSFVKADGGGVLYRRVDLDAWLEANLIMTAKGSK